MKKFVVTLLAGVMALGLVRIYEQRFLVRRFAMLHIDLTRKTFHSVEHG